jgi:hypothetical protein
MTSDIWMAPGLPFLPDVPWWAVFMGSFVLGATLGWVVRMAREQPQNQVE